MKTAWILVVMLALLAGATPALGQEQAGSQAAGETGRSASVAGGGTVVLVESSRSADQWAGKRPQYRELRPRTPTQTD